MLTFIFLGSVLSFDVEKATAFEVPLGNVSHCTNAKNEVTLEFHQNDDASVSLMELRFHIPTDPNSSIDPVQVYIFFYFYLILLFLNWCIAVFCGSI